jgi:hypothetical protein
VHVVDSFFREEPDNRNVVFLRDVGFSQRETAELLGFRVEDLEVTVRFQAEADIFSFLTGSISATQAHKVAIPANSVVLLSIKTLYLQALCNTTATAAASNASSRFVSVFSISHMSNISIKPLHRTP